jgi:tetratricopeptide (TPR) repeat protein
METTTMKTTRAALLLFLLVTYSSSGAFASEPPSEREATINRAIELHDQGNYEAAIQLYESLLEENSNDGLVLYEMSMSYAALKDHDKCIEYARRSSRIKSKSQASAFSMVASCQDDSGNLEEALKTFAEGIKRFPNHAALNFNYAISLLRHNQPGRARKALRVAIKEAPAYPSPYRVYASLLHSQGFTAGGVLMDLRFILAEPGSDRAIDAASRVLGAFEEQLSVEEGAERHINLTFPDEDVAKEEGEELGHLNLALGVGGAVSHKAEDGTPLGPSERAVAALQLFMLTTDMVAEKKLKKTFVWQTAVEPLLELQKKDALEPFLFHVAALARVEGAAQWLNANREATDKLNAALTEFHERWRKESQ